MDDRIRARLPYLVIAVLCAAIGIYLAVNQSGEATLERGGDDVRAGQAAKALAELDGLDGQASARAAALRGDAHLQQGRYAQAAAELSAAARRAPNDWVLQRDYAVVLRALGRRPKSRARMQRALALNPRMQLPLGFRSAKRVRSKRRR